MFDHLPGRFLVQTALMRLYRSALGRVFLRSTAGAWLFEKAYVAYKFVVEAGPIGRLSRRIRPGTWAIDVGANIGVFTVLFARRVQNGGRVIAIEPEPRNLSALRRRLEAANVIPRVVIHAGVAAERSGTLRLALNPHHPGDHRLSSDGLPVVSRTLDDLTAEQGAAPVSLVKIDVQGAELRVLQGARDLLVRDKPDLFIEIDDAALRRQGSSAADVISWLSRYGYAPYTLRRYGDPCPLDGRALQASVDVLFVPARNSSDIQPESRDTV